MKLKIFIIFCLCSSIGLNALDCEFVMHEVSGEFQEGMEVSALDFDFDGDNDLLTVGTTSMLWLNDGNGNFSSIELLTNYGMPRSIRAADLDDDDDNDIVIATLTSNQVIILENTNMTFTSSVLDNSLVMPHTIDLKDLDGDGDIDILCSEFDMSNALSEIVWWQNEGNMEFSDKITISEVFQQSTFVFGDYINDDEYMDVVACGEINNDVIWWQNDGNQNFTVGEIIDDNITRIHTVIGSDLDGDDDIDVLGSACNGGLIAWWENDGSGDFSRHDLGALGGALWMDSADFDIDGDQDLYAVGQSPSFALIYENDGEQNFTANPLPGEFNDGFSAASADFDNDGDLDLAAIGRSSDQICWWENLFYSVQFTASPTSGHFPLEVQFTDASIFIDPINTWEWDFDNDGIIDSQQQNPIWEYTEPGVYSIRLNVTTSAYTKSILIPDMISVFNGESALDFPGDAHLNCPAALDMNITQGFTFEAWINPAQFGSVNNIGFGRIFDKTLLSAYLIENSTAYNSHSLVFEFENSAGDLIRCNTLENSITLNVWQHLAITYDGINDLHIYLDGSDTAYDSSIPPEGNIADNTDEDLLIGMSANQVWGFTGLIDEIRLWQDVRTHAEIQNMMFYHQNGYETDLLACWELNEGYGEIAHDLTSHQHDAVINNAQWCQGMELVPASNDENQIAETPDLQLRAYPNPFNPATIIEFTLPFDDHITLVIYNAKGQKINTLVDCYLPSDTYEIHWDGTNGQNKPVSSGLYLYQVQTSRQTRSGKITLLK
ncbi:MAG: FG-GAP-like repeat-containing protein [Candidatus Stygibacter australis]|nr:FG-GAP-like repeat-containing protein [Candidatus Stygibacter australis]